MSYKFIQNKQCEYFPCHSNIKEDQLNCLFCFCPLYSLKENCGGNMHYLEDGTKDCSNCTVTHLKETGYNHVMSKIQDVLEQTKKQSR